MIMDLTEAQRACKQSCHRGEDVGAAFERLNVRTGQILNADSALGLKMNRKLNSIRNIIDE